MLLWCYVGDDAGSGCVFAADDQGVSKDFVCWMEERERVAVGIGCISVWCCVCDWCCLLEFVVCC